MSVDHKIIKEIRGQKLGIFAERDTAQEALDYAHSLFSTQSPAAVTTAMMVYHNTLLENVAKILEDYTK